MSGTRTAKSPLRLVSVITHGALAAVLVALFVIGFIAGKNISETRQQEAQYLEFCDKTYHQKLDCPKYGEVQIPAEVFENPDPGHLKWCDRIYHQNATCPRHEQVEIPEDVKAKQEARYLEWCDSISHRNVGCPRYSVDESEWASTRKNEERLGNRLKTCCPLFLYRALNGSNQQCFAK